MLCWCLMSLQTKNFPLSDWYLTEARPHQHSSCFGWTLFKSVEVKFRRAHIVGDSIQIKLSIITQEVRGVGLASGRLHSGRRVRVRVRRNGGNYLFSQCDMNSFLATNVKCGNTEVKKWSRSMYHISPYKDMMMLIITWLYDRSIT